MRLALLVAALLAALSVAATTQAMAAGVPCPERPKCTGCGCKGGPGYRELSTGKCVGFKQLAKRCGSPPDAARCTFENAPGTGENYQCALDLDAASPNPFINNSGN